MMQFKAFKPEALNKIAGAMGYQGDMSQFQQFIEGDPQRKAQMERYTNAALACCSLRAASDTSAISRLAKSSCVRLYSFKTAR
jgi:hypothetical protein